ncbi:MAG: SIS domain-containing protein [Candidatus Eremiobacteraeota bacterium]|nr:SIS domain-containing protein [Candidatus Eremiobacteraeota bacterium]
MIAPAHDSDDDREARVEVERAAMRAHQPRDRATRLRYNYEELTGQPAAIRETLTVERDRIRAVARLLAERVRGRIYGIGCGDSWSTSQAVRGTFETLLDLPFEVMQALEFTRYGRRFVGAGDVVIGLSASGTTAETVRGLQAAREAGALTIGVTNDEGSLFTQVPDTYLLGHAIRRASFPTQASTVGLAALLALASEAARVRGLHDDLVREVDGWLEALPKTVERIIAAADPLAARLGARWVDRAAFLFVGAGPGLAAAMFGASKIREGCEGYGWVLGTEEFHHYDVVQPGDPVFLIAPDDAAYPRAVDVARAVHDAGGVLYSVVSEGETAVAERSAVVFRIPATPAHLVGLPSTLPMQLAAWHIAHAKLQSSQANDA